MYISDSNHLANKEDVFRNKELLEAIKQLKNGDEKGFEIIYHQTYKYIYSRAKTMFSDEQQVQDLVQEVYVAVYRNIQSLKSDESLYAWLRTITFQQGTKLMRKDRKELLLSEENEEMFDSILDEDAEVENDLVDRQDIEIIRACINKLSSEHKSVILAYYYDNLKVEDIAELLEISVGTVKSRLHSARKKLKNYIEEQEKKQGYKLHSFGGITFILVMESMLQENMSLAEKTVDISFASICKELGIKATPIPKVNIASSTEVHEMKSIFTKIAELGTKKAIAVAVGTVAVTGTVGVTGAVLVNENILFHEHAYVEEVITEPMCETDGVKTFTCECGDSYTEVIAALGHNFETYVSNEDATYLVDGTETATCVCGAEDTRTAVGSKLEYTFEDMEQTLYAKENVIVYSMPSEEGEEIGTLREMDEVEVTGKCNETSWYKIVFNDSEGYVAENDIGVRYFYQGSAEGGYTFEEPEVDELSPNQKAVVNAGLHNVVALPNGGYGVMVTLEEGFTMYGEDLIRAYVSSIAPGYEPVFTGGGGISGYNCTGIYCSGIQPIYNPADPLGILGEYPEYIETWN